NEPLASTFFLGVPTPPSSTLFPYTTLFRSGRGSRASAGPPRSPPARAGGAPAPPPEAPWRAAWCCRPSFPGRGRGAGRRPPTPFAPTRWRPFVHRFASRRSHPAHDLRAVSADAWGDGDASEGHRAGEILRGFFRG